MKITFTQHRELSGGQVVKPGDTMETSKTTPDDLLQAYINNGIATEVASGKAQPAPADKTEGGI